ncbi:receptor expression-enhancing protein 1-like isoform X2 [Ctenocephalides felis]|uniref:receptor expression-enhancing protein 1-like isoform X2 n=1 Tax=Ctenocephalides felis TaxID=7515 RepID=UPI000E6E513C|nr:receptor expression-enhancing protein 1-like isoform X2 [Ctenocephalides felis]
MSVMNQLSNHAFLSRIILLICGLLYPAYCSYKCIKSKDVKGYVRWMMYWVVFATFTAFETFGDILISWFPFYYEFKVLFLSYLLSPAKGSTIVYRRVIHPILSENEAFIDAKIANMKGTMYAICKQFGSNAVKVASTTIVQSAAKYIPKSVSDFALSAQSETSEGRPVRRSQSNDVVDRGFESSDDISEDTGSCARSRSIRTKPITRRTKRNVKNSRSTLRDQAADVDI